MTHDRPFVPADFVAPRRLEGQGFVLEPLGPQHNESDGGRCGRCHRVRERHVQRGPVGAYLR